MTPQPSNVLPFPSWAAAPFELAQPVQRTIRLAELNKLSADERADYIASIIRAAIGFARRKGRRMESLPPQLRVWLLELCDVGDPTCLTVRDWLIGNLAVTAYPAVEEA